MGKNIIICSDGTGNTAVKNRGTNVFKLFESVDLNGHRTNPRVEAQVALYDDGVGTQTFTPLKVLGGAFGYGLARNVRKLYTELVRIYDPEDRIYLFGFSRGAFTARTLAGMIAKCGVLDRRKLPTTDDMNRAVRKAYRTYRRSYRTWIQAAVHGVLHKIGLRKSDPDAMAQFRKKHSLDCEVRIKFMGVWDTVDAVGGPFHISDVINAVIHRFKFPDHILSDKVDHACHALAIDEARAAFEPLLWEADDRIEQVWFAGVHSNVGGGYPKQGMSLVTLDWMLHAAQRHGLRLIEGDAASCREHANADDKLYDSRAGFGVFYRWKPRDVHELCRRQKAGLPVVFHLSALERIAHGTDGYNPEILKGGMKVTFTRSNHRDPVKAAEEDAMAGLRAEAVQAVVEHAFRKRGAMLAKVGHTLAIGRLSYYLYVLACAGVLVAAAVPEGAGPVTPWVLLKSVASLAGNIAVGEWGPLVESAKRLVTTPAIVYTLLAGFAASGALAMYVDRVRGKTFSRFWHNSRQELRTALKDLSARAQAAGAAER